MTYTRRQWAIDFLHAIGNPAPTEPVIDFVAGWTAMETSAGGGASYNLLNTEQRAAGSWNFNSAGVQNYPTYAEGVETNAHVLENGLYNPLVQALAANDTTSLGLNGQPPSYGVQRSLTNWVKGPGYTSIDGSYVNGVVSLAHSASVPGQSFPGGAGSVPTAAPPAGSGSSGGSSSSSGGGLAPQVQTSPGYTTTTGTTSSGGGFNPSDPLGTGQAIQNAEQNLVSLAAKIFQATILLVVAVTLIAIGLFLLLGPAAGNAASNIPVINVGESSDTSETTRQFTEREGKALNPKQPKQPKPKASPKAKAQAAAGQAAQVAAVAP